MIILFDHGLFARKSNRLRNRIEKTEAAFKNKKRGRVKANEEPEKVTVIQDRFTVSRSFDESAFDKALFHLGYYPLITNKPLQDLSLHEAMMAHKNQYKGEHTNRRAKSGLNLEPVYLHTPERIEAIFFLLKIALQLLVLMERTARKNIEQRDRGLDQLMPNRNDVRKPNPSWPHSSKLFRVRFSCMTAVSTDSFRN
jgi:transposase